MKFVLHIGTNKTGTSSLQDCFYKNRHVLAEHGVLYPDIGLDGAAHHDLSRTIKRGDPDALGIGEDWRAFIAGASRSFETILFSSENFHTIGSVRDVGKYFPPGLTKVVVYLREHSSYLGSWYQQAVQARNLTSTFDEFIKGYGAHYSLWLRPWVEVFGKDNVIVRVYERSQLRNNDIISDFASLIPGIDEVSLSLENEEKNPSISGNLLFLKCVLNHFISDPESKQVVYEFTSLSQLDQTFLGRMFVPEHLVKRISYEYRRDRAELQQRFGISLEAREEEIAGSLCPDTARIREDWQKILEGASAEGMRLVEYLYRIPGMDRPEEAGAISQLG
jgi:hypothetical protein